MTDVRKPPIGEIYRLHLPREKGKCDWCGLPCNERTPVRKQLRQTHYACSDEIQLIQSPAVARDAVYARDQGICCDCGEDWSDAIRWAPANGFETSTGERLGVTSLWHWVDLKSHRSLEKCDRGAWPYTEIRIISLWHVDHRVPLWKVRHMPAVQRIEYFKLANLVTRCEPCHKRKSAREAAEKAKFDQGAKDLNAEPGRKTRWPKPKMKSRGFSKVHRPMRARRLSS